MAWCFVSLSILVFDSWNVGARKDLLFKDTP